MRRHQSAKTTRNLLRNASLDRGRETVAGWEWVVVSGQPSWNWSVGRSGGKTRSIRILQDGRGAHGEFRQAVRCAGSRRYRLHGWIRAEVDGTGSQSGANLYLRSLAGDRQVHDMWFRPFLVGLNGWALWSEEYVTPPFADTLIVSFDMRHSCGVALFDDLALYEVPEPAVRSMPLSASTRRETLPPVAGAVVVSEEPPRRMVVNVLCPLLGEGKVQLRKPSAFSQAALLGLAEKKLVIMSPGAFAAAFAGGIRRETVEERLVAPCARVDSPGPLARGFAGGDVIPWRRRAVDGERFRQERIAAPAGRLDKLRFETVASNPDGRPVVLWRRGRRGGILVMDVGILDEPPGFGGEANLACLIVTNALGRPQTSTGRFVHPGYPLFNYESFCEELRAVAQGTPGLRLREEGRSAEGRPVYSLSVGREDAPAFYVDCGIHSDEWAPCFGAILYAQRLAHAFNAGEPWARALLRDLKLLCIPLLSPDGWDIHRRFIRGLDLNRNFPLHWHKYTGGAKGAAALSEPEARVVAGLFRREQVVAAVNWHETTANTNWVGFPRADGRYRKYAVSVPSIFRQVIDGREFLWQAATWTQIFDPRNFQWHRTESYPYVRDYGPQRVPYELHYADSLGIDGLTVEQYGNSDLSSAASPQRTETTAQIIEMLFGLQVGLVCRAAGGEAMRVSAPVVCGSSRGTSVVYGADGRASRKARLRVRGGLAIVKAEIPPGGVLVAELDPPPWRRDRSL